MEILLVIVFVFLAFIIWLFWAGRNRLVMLSVDVDEANAQIHTQLQRRYDLIPNLVETVKAYAKYEKETFEKITEARNILGNALKTSDPELMGKAEGHFQRAQAAILLVAEKYPDLKASGNFLSLQEELTATENKVAYARQAYNDSVREYNTGIQVFPAVMVAGMLGFHQREMFEISSTEAKEAPEVEL